MHELVQFLKDFDFHTILSVVVACWWFTRGIKKDIKEIKKDSAEALKEIHKEFKFINIRLSRVEGTTYGRDIYKVQEEKTQ